MLDAYSIPFYIRGAAFSKLYPGMQIKDYNTQTFMVPAEQHTLVRELLAEFIKPTSEVPAGLSSRPFGWILRCLLEALLFGWIVTGKPWQKDREKLF